VLGVYLVLTAIGVGVCAAAGLDLFTALVSVFAAISTGGFAATDASLASLSPAARTAVCAVCLAGALSFSRYYRGNVAASLRDPQLATLLALTAAGGLAVGLSLRGETASAWSHGAWMAVSAQTTAGFSSLPASALPDGAKLALIGQMLVGGEIGSTAGGLKTLRLVILAQLVIAAVLRSSLPRGASLPLRVAGTRLGGDEIQAAAALAAAYAAVTLLSWGAFVACGHDPLDSLFDVVSAVGTVGISAGTVGPELAPVLKGVLCLDMLMGRVEMFAFFVLVFPATWAGRRRSAK
jgi:trk system potassium uptake protein TrkH